MLTKEVRPPAKMGAFTVADFLSNVLASPALSS